jgi:branched-chain amino acid transport system substrate-binding protein
MILGPLCSSELMAIAPINEKTVIMSTSATSPDITNAGEYIFRAVTSDLLRSKVFARYIFQEKNVKEISVIYENDVAGNDFFKSFKEEFESLGGKVIISEQYAKGSTDMRTQLTAIKTKNPSSILMLSYPGETGLILKQMKELDIRAQLFEGFEVMKDPQIKEIAGDAIEGVIFIQPEVPSSQKTMNFITAYKEKYNQDPVFFAAEAYDVINLYAKVLEEGTSSESIKNNLYKIKDYEGASGKITFDENGDVIKPFEIGQIQNLEPVTIKIV